MKIIHIANKYDYGRQELGFSNEYTNLYETLVQMNGGENEVLFFPVDELAREKSALELNKKLIDFVLKEKPKAVFFNGGKSVIRDETIKKISKEDKIITFTWRLDDHWAFYSKSKYSAHLFNWIFTSDPLAIKKYRKIGYNNAVFMPQGFNHFLYKLLDLSKIYDVTFIGRPHGKRKEEIEKLKKAGIKVECFGEGWPNGKITNEEMIKIFCQSKINLNLSQSSGKLWKQIGLIFLKRKIDRSLRLNSPLKWYGGFQTLLAQKRKQIKGRIFKVTGCGGFLLTDYTEGIEGLYETGKEIVCFSDFDDLIKKIKYYLKHNEEREKIAQAGYEYSLREHTCEKRFNEIFKIINLK